MRIYSETLKASYRSLNIHLSIPNQCLEIPGLNLLIAQLSSLDKNYECSQFEKTASCPQRKLEWKPTT